MSDISSAASTINAVMADPVPKIDAVRDTVVELVKGIYTTLGWERHAIVREMNGSDEEYLASLESRSALSYPEYMSAMLKRTVVSIGDIEIRTRPEVIDDLIVGDRDLLFLAVVKATYGNIRVFSVTCPACGETSDLNVDIDEDFPMQGTHEEAIAPIEVTLRNGVTYSFQLPTGGDTKVVSKKGKSIAEQNTVMISRCLLSPTVYPNKEQWARSLNIADRGEIITALLETRVGPKAGEVNDPCPNCGEMIRVNLDWVSLLFG